MKIFNILTPSNGILIVSYDHSEWNEVLKKNSIFFFQGSPLCIFLKIFENFPRVPPLHIFINFELLELVIVIVVEGEGEGGGEGGEGGAWCKNSGTCIDNTCPFLVMFRSGN